jgi:hypothetical protein
MEHASHVEAPWLREKELAATGCAIGQDCLLEKVYEARQLAAEYLRPDRNDRTSYELNYIGQHVLSFFNRENQAMFEVLESWPPALPATRTTSGGVRLPMPSTRRGVFTCLPQGR